MVVQLQRRQKVGILGGGQLGRMLAIAAQQMGFQAVVFCQKPGEPAAQIADEVVVGAWNDPDALLKFATSGIRVVVCEWENAPVSCVEFIGRFVPVGNLAEILRVGSDRLEEKSMATKLGLDTTKYFPFEWSIRGIEIAQLKPDDWRPDLIVKTRTLGYDGQGQWHFTGGINSIMEQRASFFPKGAQLILEERVDLAFECSIKVGRTYDGRMIFSPLVKNVHTNRYGGGILSHSMWWNGIIEEKYCQAAQGAAAAIAEHLDLQGQAITIEFFVTNDDRLLVNEIAPRVHNSFHGSIEAAAKSQFHWHIALAAGWPVEDMLFTSPFIMTNLIGSQIEHALALSQAGWSVHDYGKAAVRDGRKMGHATILLRYPAEIRQRLEELNKIGVEVEM